MPAHNRLDIAVTDRNPHVRDFLCRELSGLGHGASALTGADELVASLSSPTPPQVLVLDPEAAGPRLAEVARRIKDGAGRIVVLLHVFPDAELQPDFAGALVVEKEPRMGPLKAALVSLAARLDSIENAAERTQEKS
jgi:hypothetical protein